MLILLRFIILLIFFTIFINPQTLKADETIPLKFKEGDVISANIINTLLKRLNDVQEGFSSRFDLDGDWICTTSTSIQNNDLRCVEDGLLYSKTGTMSFDSNAGTWLYSGTGGNDGIESCGAFASNGTYDVKANRLILKGSVSGTTRVDIYPLTRSTPNIFRWEGANDSIVECEKISVPPNPASSLIAEISESKILLSWDDNSEDEDGFIIERKSSLTGSWAPIKTTGSNETNYEDVKPSSGVYWYRIVAINIFGHSISSNEVLVNLE